jgi:hypothetical protein
MPAGSALQVCGQGMAAAADDDDDEQVLQPAGDSHRCHHWQRVAAGQVVEQAVLTRCTLHCLPCRHPGSRVAATVVYNEFIQNRHHVHMNSTRWLTLTDFVKHLGKEGGWGRLPGELTCAADMLAAA